MKFKDIDILEKLQPFFQWIFGIQHWNTVEGWVARILVWIILTYFLLSLLKHLLDIVSKIAEAWKSLGLQVTKSSVELSRLRRRQQFCRVLAADLATLAKSENWNDQFFTDLEAEVEADGGYYASRADRLFGRRSQGLRRVPSLIQAMESSTEQCLLLMGEPGSGKSVALRHLANQLAEKAAKSKSQNEKIPLYLNLKELPEPPIGGPSADFIKEFVFENIRRGDADTAAYVRDNWSVYRERGHWFFLFDSFDEIPAVLHAPTGSPTIRAHADAIRQFLEGMSACRGAVASREFKGPDNLPWKRFKILQLSPRRQEELIENSFLSPEQKLIALQHTAVSGPGLLSNPLFLTLLCRYVKEEDKPPANDNELLLKHIYRLANREPEFVRRKYDLTPEQLVEGSIELAVLFAEQTSLSLAPTQDQIFKSLSSASQVKDKLERLLAALIDVKIGRCDVKEASAGDRRFTFAHRRYQETLFVQYLARNPIYLSPNTLLTDSRWRDYTVTLLQTSPTDAVLPILAEASILLQDFARGRHGTPVLPGYGSSIQYFEWNDCPGSRIIRLLQEGLGRRLDTVPIELRENVKRFLTSPWAEGDSYDRLMVISLGGLLPESDLQETIEFAIKAGTIQHWDAAVASSFFLTRMPEEIAGWFRVQLANRLLLADRRSDVLKIEAIAARAPRNIGAGWIVRRVSKIRGLYRIFSSSLKSTPLRKLLTWPRLSLGRNETPDDQITVVAGMQFYAIMPMSILLILGGHQIWRFTRIGAAMFIVICALVLVYLLRNLWLLSFRAVGDALNPRSIAKALNQRRIKLVRTIKLLLRHARALVLFLAFIAVSYGAIGGVIHLIARMFGYNGSILFLYAFGPPIAVALLTNGILIISRKRDRWLGAARLLSESADTANKLPLILRASSWRVAKTWMRYDVGKTIPSNEDARSFLRFIDAVIQGTLPLGGTSPLECRSGSGDVAYIRGLMINNLVNRNAPANSPVETLPV